MARLSLVVWTSSLTSSTAEVDLLRTRIFLVEAVGTVAAAAGPEEGELAIFHGSRAKEKKLSIDSYAEKPCWQSLHAMAPKAKRM